MCAAGLALAGWVVNHGSGTSEAADAGALRAEIRRHWHGEIVTRGLQTSVAPLVSLPTRPVRIDDLTQGDLVAALHSLSVAAAVYPDGFLDRVLKRAVLAGRIRMWDSDVGGFFVGNTVAINDQGVSGQDGALFSADTFHHELSSIVRDQVLFNVSEWTANNPPGFNYPSLAAYKALLAKPPSVEGDAGLHAQGFVAAYGTTSLDNDWNTYAEKVFGHGPAFVTEIRDYPRMRAKTRQLLDVYSKLDPGFAVYFQQSGLSQAVSDAAGER